MPELNVSPTKSNLLTLRRQLAFAEEGYDLLDQKRQILIYELLSRLERGRRTEQQLEPLMKEAFAALSEALLDAGSEGLARSALGVRVDHEVRLSSQSLMGLRLPGVQTTIPSVGAQFGLTGTSINIDQAMRRFLKLLPVIAALAELENAVLRLTRELRKTQRRCNALSKIFIPAHEQAIKYITGSLEERERESFTILKMIRKRLYPSDGAHPAADA